MTFMPLIALMSHSSALKSAFIASTLIFTWVSSRDQLNFLFASFDPPTLAHELVLYTSPGYVCLHSRNKINISNHDLISKHNTFKSIPECNPSSLRKVWFVRLHSKVSMDLFYF